MIPAGGAVYRLLMLGSKPDADSFDVHVAACIFALAFWEAMSQRKPFTATTGLEPNELAAVIEGFFPHRGLSIFIGTGCAGRPQRRRGLLARPA